MKQESEKEAYEEAIDLLTCTDEYPTGFGDYEIREEREIAEKYKTAIRAYVAALEKYGHEMADNSMALQMELAAKDAEITRLSKIWEQHPISAANWDRWNKQMEDLEQQLAAEKAERDRWQERHRVEFNRRTEDIKQYNALRSRIESAPRVWGRYHSEDPTRLLEITADSCEMRSWAMDCPWSPVRQVHAVPVEEKE
jgi:hypothetical protein